MTFKATVLTLCAVLLLAVPVSTSALEPFGQDFESLVQSDTAALTDAGWLVFANVFDAGMGYLYGYGPFGAPNDGSAFCLIAVGQGDAAQGAQQLVVFSDYNNTDHAVGNFIEANVFVEQTVDAGQVGQTWDFDFQAKMGDLAGATTALAFIKTIDPNNNFTTTNFITVDLTATPAGWTDYELNIAIDAGLVGQLLQVGFSSTATGYETSGVFYDNIAFHEEGQTSTEASTWGGVKALFR